MIKLARAAESIGSRTQHIMASAGLSTSQFAVLDALLHLGPLCQKELGEKILKTSGNMTMVIDNLEKGGLVFRERQIDDRRFVLVHLSDGGRALMVDLFPRHAAAISREMAILSPAEQDELGRLCKKLGLQTGG
ncbi:MAG: MarR family transcriptional regulator [Candidatus Marinimicrobia bacterium]|nr:MarR family transcriptional regulator [Candidatus Neomarinimicrobiota bacterium]